MDITDKFRSACQSLCQGSLINHEHFTLAEIMSTIEIMDQKMDFGIHKNFRTCEKAIESGDLPLSFSKSPDSQAYYQNLIDVFDFTLSAMVNWLESDMLCQTVYTNMYLHCSSQIEDSSLRVVCDGFNYLVGLIHVTLISMPVYREEDFSVLDSMFPLKCNFTYSELIESIEKIDKGIIQNEPTSQSFSKRLRLLNLLVGVFQLFVDFFNLSDVSAKKNTIDFSLFKQNFNNSLDVISKTIASIIESNVKIFADNIEPTDNVSECWQEVVFAKRFTEPLLNINCLPPIVTKKSIIVSRSFAFKYFQALIMRIRFVFKMLSFEPQKYILRQLEFIKFFGQVGLQLPSIVYTLPVQPVDIIPIKLRHTCLLSRSIMGICFLKPINAINDLVENSLEHTLFCCPSLKRCTFYYAIARKFYEGTQGQTVIEDFFSDDGAEISPCKELEFDSKNTFKFYAGYLSRLLLDAYLINCLNRSRQHIMLSMQISQFIQLSEHAQKLDFLIMQKRGVRQPINFCSDHLSYLIHVLSWDYLHVGFDLDLYSHYELPGLYYYAFEKIFYPFDILLKSLLDLLRSNSNKSQKSRRKINKTNETGANSVHTIHIISLEHLHFRVKLYSLLVRANVYAFAGLALGDKIKLPFDFSSESNGTHCEPAESPLICKKFGNYRSRFINRFASIAPNIDDVFERFQSFWTKTTCNKPAPVLMKDALQEALSMFDKSKEIIETFEYQKTTSSENTGSFDFATGASPSLQQELDGLLKVCKHNSVVCKLLTNSTINHKLRLEFSPFYTRANFFPIFSLKS